MALLEMTNISKAFFGITVLNHVNFTVEAGEVHALLGENGAGKSTLMNILAGVYTRDGGSVLFDGRSLDHTTVTASESVGIAFVHQELNLFNDLKVYENIFLRKELQTRFGMLKKKAMILKARELLGSLGVEIDPSAMVSQLEPGKKQLLEIAKALFANARLFILDEPTTALNNSEIQHLFNIINRLKAQGKSFIFISHKMNEVFLIADCYTVLRGGEVVKTGLMAQTTSLEVTKLMVGNGYSEQGYYTGRQLGEPVLELHELSGRSFTNVNLKVLKGEIVGLTGLMGSGISALFQTIFGILPLSGGTLVIGGQPIRRHSIQNAMGLKVAMIAPNRKEDSVLPDFSLLENMYVSQHTLSARQQIIYKQKEILRFGQQQKALDIKANSCHDMITSLSGGNQQKVILARWLNTDADIFLLDNPTLGIDIGAKAEIYKLILNLAKAGKTVLINTMEIPEVQKVADRCIVFYHGCIQAVLERNEISEETVMLYATNAINPTEVLAQHG